MKVLITGGTGFLGWHTRCLLHASGMPDATTIDLDNADDLAQAVRGADAILHLAGINRASETELSDGNARLARELVAATEANPVPMVYANSIQAGNGTPYGDGKAAAAEILGSAARERGSVFVDVRLPNLFGEYGRPNYNSFVATFIDRCIKNDEPSIDDRPIALLHAQGAASALVDGLTATESAVVEPQGHPTSVLEVWEKLRLFRELYAQGEIPAFPTQFDIDLFNSFRAALFPASAPIPLDPKTDDRGRLVETMRAHGSAGQTFVSTTKPGITRGDHYHLSKIERFVVLEGQARIALRRLFTPDVVEFHVTGDAPVAVDMPTMWTHNITNTGDGTLVTQFWTNELFDPERPDTFWVKVDSEEHAQ